MFAMNVNGMNMMESEYILRHHRHEISENQCSSVIVKHIKSPIHLLVVWLPHLWWPCACCGVGVVDQVGFHRSGTAFELSNLPIAIELYAVCYTGHSVFPNIYTSIEKPSQFPTVLIVW
ncbi:Vacuolar amino acid transporter like [Thalictrum thalictroides]|uniref:Vacuolar amino acid transporter like n=1 Tax=Thalictrum thalictroides TaxID=46969 RepID=A0A7J6V2T7_THATH|nr:Vacuolar amino acid transporter like [Thalictrum thalictroides]